jgi:transposase-like protein
MTNDHCSDECQQLSEELEQERRGAGGLHQWRCSEELRARIVSYAEACREDGESHSSLAKRLGLAQPTLSRWVRKAQRSPAGFREMAIVPSQRRSAPAASEPTRLITPRGFVVEGLEPELLAYLLQVIG